MPDYRQCTLENGARRQTVWQEAQWIKDMCEDMSSMPDEHVERTESTAWSTQMVVDAAERRHGLGSMRIVEAYGQTYAISDKFELQLRHRLDEPMVEPTRSGKTGDV